MSIQPPNIRTARLTLRLAVHADAPKMVRYYRENSLHFAPWMPRLSEDLYTVAYWEKQIPRYREEFDQDRALRLFLFSNDPSERVIGHVSFNQIVRGAAHYCVLGYMLAEDAQGQGVMTEALTAALDYVFDSLRIHRVMANYMPHNRRSGNLLRRLGFTVEGYARDYLYIAGRWEDHILTSLTNPRWQPL